MNRVYIINLWLPGMNERVTPTPWRPFCGGRGYSIGRPRENDADHRSSSITCAAFAIQAEQSKPIRRKELVAPSPPSPNAERRDPKLRRRHHGLHGTQTTCEALSWTNWPDLDLLVGTQKFHRVPEMLDAVLASQRGLGPRPSPHAGRPRRGGKAPPRPFANTGTSVKVSAFVSIMQGWCNMHCSFFAIVPKDPRGRALPQDGFYLRGNPRTGRQRQPREVTLPPSGKS